MLLSVRLYYLQVQPSTQVQGELQNHQIETLSELNYRILDTNGKDLLNYKKKYVLVIDSRPFKLNNYEETLEDLLALNFIMKSEDTNFNYSDIIALNGKTYYDEITEETYNKIKKLNNIKGIYLYVYDMVDSSEGWRIENFIANIREDNIVEGSFQHQILDIVGENEYPSISFNLDQKANYTESILNYGENNKNLKLTINKEWEEKIRDILLDDSYSFLENIGVVLLESETGKIRAMVQKDESKANVNLGIGTIGYEPGSIFKVLTEAIGLDLGKISSSSVFTCEGKICTKLGEQYAHGDLTVDEALQVSCNDIFAKVGELSGYENMIEYTEKLGLYQKILGLSGENKEEAAGVKATYEDGVSNFSIGQCVTVTPLQIAGAINAVVNDGVYIKPTIIDSIIDNDDNEVEHIEVEGKRVFSETTAKIVQDSMTNVIWKGTGYEAKVEGITQGGKTGTSTGEGGKTNHGWFAGYFEMDGKKYTLLVVAPNIGDNHPDGRELGGGNTGAPIFRQIINSLISNN
ncbi:penicillin-binding protein 2 [Clostridium sp. NSJ-6]|uniref:Penicillin-binding protein 2 n=1 Tax=Clostridium hominis TaxID=2763036 RepID=A0ABR7DAQ5_9CLOT|nr:penicillin-binding transpeptidase domain-containing protein [Clostridium hominis]MBC5628417.1 penicillin-binding protein 2 [Clostridium hominis]MDU2671116.1 penicillin-binding transpeptidase domain-containing protein [Clostridium sp.]